MFGKMIGSVKKGMAILIAMTLLFVPLLGLGIWSEIGGNPAFTSLGIDQAPSHLQPGGNMEGKEVHFGIVPSAAFSVITTVTTVVRLIRCTIRSCRWAVLSRYSTSSWVK